MDIKNNLINFLYDKNYFISIYEDYIYVYNYIELINISSEKIEFKINDFKLVIVGEKLILKKMLKNEVLIKGKLMKIGINYE